MAAPLSTSASHPLEGSLAPLLLGLLCLVVLSALLSAAAIFLLRHTGPVVVSLTRRAGTRRSRWLPQLRRAGAPVDRDVLTGLPLRSALADEGAWLLETAAATGHQAGLLLLDLDGFKGVNDTLGHHVGDAVLTEMAARTRAVLADRDLAVRLGGDEFAVLVGSTTSARAVENRAETLLEALAPPMQVDGLELTVTASVGVAFHGLDGTTVDELLRAADAGMYAAKVAGPHRWRHGDPGVLGHRSSNTVRAELREALQTDQILVHYQPQVDGWTGLVTGFEALVRWRHPELGLVGPEQFLAVAERSDIIAPLTLRVLDDALRDLAALRRLAPGCSVAVNVSARSMLGHGLLDEVAGRLATSGVAPGAVVLEITEPAPRPTPELRDLLEGFRDLGVRVSVHGFGSATTSLTALWQLPAVREIKIDPQIIRDLADSPEVERLVRAMVSAAHGLDIRVVAEGVESRSAVVRLRALGCDAFQGYWLGRPTPLEELPAWHDEWSHLRRERLAP